MSLKHLTTLNRFATLSSIKSLTSSSTITAAAATATAARSLSSSSSYPHYSSYSNTIFGIISVAKNGNLSLTNFGRNNSFTWNTFAHFSTSPSSLYAIKKKKPNDTNDDDDETSSTDTDTDTDTTAQDSKPKKSKKSKQEIITPKNKLRRALSTPQDLKSVLMSIKQHNEAIEKEEEEEEAENNRNSSSSGSGSGSNKKGSDGYTNSITPKTDTNQDVDLTSPVPIIGIGYPLLSQPKLIHAQPDLVQYVNERNFSGTTLVAAFLTREQTGAEHQTTLNDAQDIHEVGTVASIRAFVNNDSPSPVFLLHPLFRVRLSKITHKKPGLVKGIVTRFDDAPYDIHSPQIKALHAGVFEAIRNLVSYGAYQKVFDYIHVHEKILELPGSLANLGLFLANGDPESVQSAYADPDVASRLFKAIALLNKNIQVLKLQQDITQQTNQSFQKHSKRVMLLEQLKTIKKELGDSGKMDNNSFIAKYKKRLEKLTVPPHALKVIKEEIAKLSSMEEQGSEVNMSRNYLDWLTSLPWGVHTEDILDVKHARTVLDQDHYGMKDVKDRILEYIAVGSLRGGAYGKIICLVGPPGVGKTSIAKSIAAALGRKYFRFSVGGIHDVSEIKGHRRTYVGAMPGKLIQALKRIEVENPLILLDEIDKLGRGGMHGDPSAALLELLDPEQNKGFLDHYLDVPFDMSKVLFVCTANTMDTISHPLQDRMEFINLAGYIMEEKIAIAKNYLIPQALKDTGLVDAKIVITDDALASLIKQYCRENGVRNLQRHIERIFRKNAFNLKSSIEAIDTDAAAALTALGNDKKENSDDSIPLVTPTPPPSPPSPSPPAPALKSDSDIVAAAAAASDTTGTARLSSRLFKKPNKTTDMETESENVNNDDDDETGALSIEKSESEAQKRAQEEEAKLKAHREKLKAIFAKLPPIEITSENLSDFVGVPKYSSDRLYDVNPVGVVTGLAWTTMGGVGLYIESVVTRTVDKDSKPHLAVTGMLGDVMKESSSIAYSFAKSFLVKFFPDNTFLQHADIHLHFPEGAIKKDGPSAGITMVTALMSLALNTPVVNNVAMTGEVSITGKVLPIGGFKEKTVAAKSMGINRVILPVGNIKDYKELPDFLKEGMEFYFASHYTDVFKVVFPTWAQQLTAIDASFSVPVPSQSHISPTLSTTTTTTTTATSLTPTNNNSLPAN